VLSHLLVSPSQSLRAFAPDYSRTARGTNEDVVIVRELIVRRRLLLTELRSPPISRLFFPGSERSEGKCPISLASFAGRRGAFTHCLPHPTS
jgi:hypothetical protein